MSEMIDKSLRVPILNNGEKLYLYTSINGLKGICEGKEFWVTERNFLNDSMEYHVATDVFCEVLDKHMRDKKLCGRIKKKIIAEVIRLQTPGLSTKDKVAFFGDYVISMSKDCDSALMWSSYADYVGYCIQFDYEKLLALFKKNQKYLLYDGNVIYNHDEQVRLIEEMMVKGYFEWPIGFDYLNSWDDFDNLTNKDIADCYWWIAADLSLYNSFFKLPCYEGEQEYRFVFSASHDGGRCKAEDFVAPSFRVRGDILIPYIKVPFETVESVEKVIVGPKNQSDIAIKGVQYLFRNLKHDVTIEKSDIPFRY